MAKEQKVTLKLVVEGDKLVEAKIQGLTTMLRNAKGQFEKVNIEAGELDGTLKRFNLTVKNSEKDIQGQIRNLQNLRQNLDITSKEYKDMGNEITVLQGKLNQARTATGNTSNAVLELGRVVQDAPYGIRGMGNNITQLATSFAFASKEAGGFTKAIKGMWASLAGPLGIVLAISAVVSILDVFADKTKKAKDEVKDLNEALKNEIDILKIYDAQLNDSNTTLSERVELLKGVSVLDKDLAEQLKEANGDAEKQNKLIEEYRKKKQLELKIKQQEKVMNEALANQRLKRAELDAKIQKMQSNMYYDEEGVLRLRQGNRDPSEYYNAMRDIEMERDFGAEMKKLRAKSLSEFQEYLRLLNQMKEEFNNKTEEELMTDPLIQYYDQLDVDTIIDAENADPVGLLKKLMGDDFGEDVSIGSIGMSFIEDFEFTEQLDNLSEFLDAKEALRLKDLENEQNAFAMRQRLTYMTAGLFTIVGESMKQGTKEAARVQQIGALINAYASINEIWSKKSTSPFLSASIAEKVLATATVGAITFGNVKAIEQQSNRLGGSSSVNSSGQGGREFDFNLVGSTGNNQLAQAVGGQFKDQTIRAYVVGSDITNRQQLDNKIKTTATFGSDDD